MTQIKTPLWKELNEKRTPGDWKVSQKGSILLSDKTPVSSFFFENAQANAQYTALAVNNFAALAEALELAANVLEHGTEEYKAVCNALNRIS